MSTVKPPPPLATVTNRDDYARLKAAGILHYRYELVEGVIRQKCTNLPHNLGVSRLTAWLYRVFTEEYVQSQSTIDVSPEDNPTNAPQPDADSKGRFTRWNDD